MTDRPPPARAQQRASPAPSRRGLYLGPLHVTFPLVVVALVLLGSTAFIGWVIAVVREEQIPLLAAGFLALGTSLAAIAIGSLVGMWGAASRAQGGRAFVLALIGGLAGLAAIGCYSVSALTMMVWNS